MAVTDQPRFPALPPATFHLRPSQTKGCGERSWEKARVTSVLGQCAKGIIGSSGSDVPTECYSPPVGLGQRCDGGPWYGG